MSIGLMIIQIAISIALILTVVLQVRKTSKASGIFGGGTTADHSGKKGKEAFFSKDYHRRSYTFHGFFSIA